MAQASPPLVPRPSRRRAATADPSRRPRRIESDRRAAPLPGGSPRWIRRAGDPSTLPAQPTRPTISNPEHAERLLVKRPLPSDEVLNALFERLMERMNLPPERVVELNMRSREQKWSLILAQHEMQSGIACVFYIEQLVRHAQPELKEKRPKKRLLENLQPLTKILADLEVDLRTNPNDSWAQEFVSMPNHGHVALVDLIKDLADNPYSVPRKHPRKYAVLEREPALLYTSLLCLKALMGHRHGFSAVLSYDPSLSVLAYCLDTQSNRVKVLILKLMITVLLAPGGHKKVMQAFDYLRAILKEKTRFQLLIASITLEPVDPTYQAVALCFFNTVVQTAQGPNAKVFHQHEFIRAGFSPEEVEKSLHGRQDERVLHELREWHNNFIDVQQYMDDLAVARGRARNLKEELEISQKYLHEANVDREALYEQTKRLMERNEKQRDKIVRLNESINNLLEVKLERDELREENEQLSEANTRYRLHTNELKERLDGMTEESKAILEQQEKIEELQQQVDTFHRLTSLVEGGTQTSESLIHLPQISMDTPDAPLPVIPIAPPPPPIPEDGTFIPPPPPIPFGAPPVPPPPPIGGIFLAPGMHLKKPVIPNVTLPMLNWIPIKNPEHTIFKDIDDESVIETVDFTEFETMFQVKRLKKNEMQAKRDETLRKLAEQLNLIESRRARNLVIAKRRIGHSANHIREFILDTDLDGLIAEHCELLLKFIPSQEELSDLAKNAHRFEEFGEAEQFMYQLAKIERYESRLNAMAYMGDFDELMNTTQPQINAVLSASLSVFRSSRVKKVFEVILAFGNYMNSSRRGAVYGFKLESLSKLTDTKSLDRKQTLLHYIVHVVETVYPHLLSFYDDLDIEEACQVSLQLLSEDVKHLRKGLEDLKFEKEKEPRNFIVFSFYAHACKKVEHLTETFSKMDDVYREVCLMFSESPKTTEPSDFFGMFQRFITSWKKAKQENHETKRKKKTPGASLLKKQSEEETKDTMAELAVEAAAKAAARSEHIRQEALKVAESKTSESEKKSEKKPKEPERVRRDVVANREKEVYDIKKRGVHRIDLKERLPWLKEVEKKQEDENAQEVPTGQQMEETVPNQREEVASPDSGMMDHLSEAEIEFDLDVEGLPPPQHESSTDRAAFTQDHIPVHLQNGGLDHVRESQFPTLPPRDYPKQLPPKDYPKITESQPAEIKMRQPLQNSLLDDTDYYALMMNAVN